MMKQFFLKGFAFAAGMGAFIALSVIVAQTLNSFQSMEVVSAARMNENFQLLESRISAAVPDGFIGAFYLSACPSGWIAADGTNGTPDLRGQFLRGLNDFGSAAGTRADGDQDPDGAGRTPGDFQAHAFASHNHGGGNHDHQALGGFGGYRGLDFGAWAFAATDGGINGYHTTGAGGRFIQLSGNIIGTQGGTETRPGNTALIFCMRKAN